ncbi:MAG: ATP-dependent DNA helicase, partial [Ilumatobacteraceae bacterium]
HAVSDAIVGQRHVVVQAGTGTGKTIGYLVPAIMSGRRTVVATATKALQDQLADKDLPFLQEHLGRPFEWAVVKGRSNYVCPQRISELENRTESAQAQLELDDMAAVTQAEVARLIEWSRTTHSGDAAELDWSPSDRAWQAVSVGSEECPGVNRCPSGASCFAEMARASAAEADVIVVNLHLYGLHVASNNALLPEHDVVVFDEAHQLEDIMSDTVGSQISGGRFSRVVGVLRRILDDPAVMAPLAEAPTLAREVLGDLVGQRLPVPLPDTVRAMLLDLRDRLQGAQSALRAISSDLPDVKQRVLRSQQLATRLQEGIDQALLDREGYVAFVAGSPESPRLEIAPLQVGEVLARSVWGPYTAVLTSATVPSSIGHRVGLPDGGFDELDVGSPFDYEANSLLYCALHLPDPRDPGYAAGVHDELVSLITAAGGRTLALFTSYRAMDAAAEAVRARVDVPVLTQRDMPKTALVRAFTEDEHSCLFATSGFFQGVDIPGRTLSLVTIDRIPFPRPDDPLLSARREILGPAAFGEIDIPRASMLLAQAVGRLIRTSTDRGVVAVFDRRLGTANYRWQIVKALPPMRRTRERADAEQFLREITT